MGTTRYVIRELAKGSPTRGKNVQYVEVLVKEVFCKDCQSKELVYEENKSLRK